MWSYLKPLLQSRRGQALTEYGLVVAIIAVGVIAALIAFKTQLSDLFTQLKDTLKTNTPT